MIRCESCAATLASGAVWCGQCFAPTAARSRGFERSVMDEPVTMANRQEAPVAELPKAVPHSRWRGSATTFGPVGRVVASLLLLLPLWFFWEEQLFAWQGIVIWGVFLMPWALRDIWRRTPIRGAERSRARSG